MQCLPYRQTLASLAILSPFSHHANPFIPTTRTLLSSDAVSGLSKHIQYRANEVQRFSLRSYRSISFDEDEDEDEEDSSSDSSTRFEEAVKLFNNREYYACHDLLESLWFDSYDPLRTLHHALLQCAVAFYHLFNQNHKGAMMEMGEGLCKLRKLSFEGGPFHQFEQEISTVLNFIYQTQLELAACNEDFCITMEQTERSYQLLEGFGAGQRLYSLEESNDGHKDGTTYIVFDPQKCYGAINLPPSRVKLPTLEATRDHLMACQN